MRRTTFAAVLLAAALGILAAWIGRRPLSPPSARGTLLLSVPLPLPEFSLRDSLGRRVALQDFRGSPWVAGFIFSGCARQCPMLTARMQALRRRLPEGARLVSFSVDPKDTPEALKRYARFHRADWLFLSGRAGEVRRLVVEGFKLPLGASGDPKEPILHSGKLALVDGEGRIRGYFDPNDESAFEELVRQVQGLVGG